MNKTFEEVTLQAFQNAIVSFLQKGDWMKVDYAARINIDAAWLRAMHARVSMDTVMELVKTQVEQRIADGIINAMVTEIATDVKSIMCNRELREDIRGVLRAKIRAAEGAIT